MTETTSPQSRRSLLAVILVAAAAALILLCTFQVRTTERALISTFGQFRTEPIGPGLHFKMPWPFQKVVKIDTTLQIYEGKYEENFTADEKTLVLTLFAVWTVDDPATFHNRVGTKDQARQLLGDLIRTEKGAVISAHPVTHLLSTDPAERRFDQVEQEILARVNAVLTREKYGIRLVSLGIEQIALPPQVTRDVLERMAGERRNKAEKRRQEGRLAAGRIRAEARVESGRIEAQAKEQSKKIRNEGDLVAAERYQVFEQDREFAIFLRQLEALESLMSRKTTLVIDRDMPPFSLLKGDFLDKPASAVAPGQAPAK